MKIERNNFKIIVEIFVEQMKNMAQKIEDFV